LLEWLAAPAGQATDLRPLLAAPVAEPDARHAAGPIVGFGSGGGVVQAPALVVRQLTRGFAHLADAARGRIVVCSALLPSAVVLLADAAGIVTDHGGLLSHGAILARELGLPAVLGTRVATARIATDELLWLDATQGLVIRI
jgi:pyruvate,water dikinase